MTSLDLKTAAVDMSGAIREFMAVLTSGDDIALPEVKIVSKTGVNWLGQCRSMMRAADNASIVTSLPSVISVQKNVTVADESFRRIVAHEVCHHVANWMVCVGIPFKQAQMEIRLEGEHGKTFWEMVAKINARYGVDYVTEKSDELIEVGEGPPIYALLWKNGDQIRWCWSARPSSKQIEYIKRNLNENGDYKVIKTNNPHLTASRGKVGDGWVTLHLDAGKQLLRDLWNTAPDVTDEFANAEAKADPMWVLLRKDATRDYFRASKVRSLTPTIKADILRYADRYDTRVVRVSDPAILNEIGNHYSVLTMSVPYLGDPSVLLPLWDQAKKL